jgi:hypothetical protein
MSYERTSEIRRKQSEKMREKIKDYDWNSILEKRKRTITENNIKVGRKKGDGPPKTGIEKPCAVCGSLFYVIKSRQDVARCCSRVCLRKDPTYLEKLKNIDRSYMSTDKYAKATRDPLRSKYKQYQRDVMKLTEENYVQYLDTINPNRFPRTLAGVDGGYHLDHKISIRYGFDNNIDPTEIASFKNLQMLPWRENIVKGKK